MATLKQCRQLRACPNCKMRTAEGTCIALNSTYFVYKCPFYKAGNFKKHIEQYKLDRLKYGGVHVDEDI